MSTGTTGRDLVCRVEQFYYREARLLDETFTRCAGFDLAEFWQK